VRILLRGKTPRRHPSEPNIHFGRADTTTTAQSELSPIRIMNLKYLPLSGIVFLALSLACILKMAAKNYWDGDASSILPGPARTSRDYIPIVYGE
jgi:hypothetical protein